MDRASSCNLAQLMESCAKCGYVAPRDLIRCGFCGFQEEERAKLQKLQARLEAEQSVMQSQRSEINSLSLKVKSVQL